RAAFDFETEVDDDVEEGTLKEAEHRLLSRFGDLDELIEAAGSLDNQDSKYDAIREWLLSSLQNDDKGGVLLFSHFRGTLAYLDKRLKQEGVRCAVLTGETAMLQREELRNMFARGDIDVLLSSEVGSEGLDQQHCHRLINYDLPWNPMRIEQRIGRLDRFGQEAEVITIVNLAVEGTIDAAILGRLFHRIRIFEDSIGMLDPLLGRAMRLVARNEFNHPEANRLAGSQFSLVDVNTLAKNDASGNLDELLQQRERWLSERATEEREWLGSDPGISGLREETIQMELGVRPDDLLEWTKARLNLHDKGSRIHEINGNWHFIFTDTAVQTLAHRCEDYSLPDHLTRGWKEKITKLANSASPHIIPFMVTREEAREESDFTYLAPWHPIVQWLRSCPQKSVAESLIHGWQDSGEKPTHKLTSTRPLEWPQNSEFVICLDWAVKGLTSYSVRRWLILDENGLPIANQIEKVWNKMENLEMVEADSEYFADIESALDKIHGWLLEDEKARISPLLDELRHNVQRSWMHRIEREREQIQAAKMKEFHTDEPPDPRWLRMKLGMIERLTVEMDERILTLEKIREGVQAELSAPFVIKLGVHSSSSDSNGS
ncbi:MAG: SWF/SNF helicase family protein, partial [Euryarchaeota archaeon]|nr:SWF/SNF helicase family protein [Euryarchaeota archaeon]